MRNRFTMILTLVVFLAIPAGFASAANDKQLLGLWDDLGTVDEGKATLAVLTLAKMPEQTISFLKTRLQPIVASEERIAGWIGQLDDEQRSKRSEAAEELLWLGDYARPALQEALEGELSARVRARIVEILENLPESTKPDPFRDRLRGSNVAVSNINGQVEIIIDGKPLNLGQVQRKDPQRRDSWLRATRAIALLESLGGDEAVSILEKLAEGEPDAAPTREARIALKRLD